MSNPLHSAGLTFADQHAELKVASKGRLRLLRLPDRKATLQSEVASPFTGDVRIALSRDLQIPFSLESGTTLPSPESPCYYARAPICAMPPLENPKVESHGRLLGLGGASV